MALLVSWIDMAHKPSLLAPILPELWFGARARAGRKTPLEGKGAIPPIGKRIGAEDLPRTHGNKRLLSHFGTDHRTGYSRLLVGRFDKEGEKPVSVAKDRLGLSGAAAMGGCAAGVCPGAGQREAAGKRREFDGLALDTQGSLVEGHAGVLEADSRDERGLD
ncbi:hypothetical protein [Candidatus Methylacidithermus pantelleriae]|nr:hypothetical protein [Candidatus Methylacidithermus pantelleriae]